jgi:acetylornithine/succinyldiaminopimelate/putrescine aminotransferase
MKAVANNAQSYEAQHLLQVYGQLPIEPVSAHGVYLQCNDRKLIDLYGGHAVAALGYGHPEMLAALKIQAESMFFQSNAVALNIRARAAETLAEFAPAGLDHVFFVNSGGEANENALRMAIRLTGRKKIVAVQHGFHGRTAAAGAVTWGARDTWYGFPRTPFDVDFIPRNDVNAVAGIVDSETAAVILELVQGVAGAVDLDANFVSEIKRACNATGALLIIDEVQTGIGRCGRPFAADLYNVDADMLTTAKALAGGFPCGAVLCNSSIAAEMKTGDLGTTFGGGPLACALIDTVIKVIKRDGLMQNVERLSGQLAAACPMGPVVGIQGKGFLIGLKCSRPARDIQNELLDRNLLVGTSADPEVIRLLPPLVLEEAHMQTLIDNLADIPATK